MSGVFISYRRSDSAPWAGRLRDRLVTDLGASQVFFDVDSIDLGADFRDVIAATLAACDVVIVLIGPSWLAADADGTRRIDDEHDVHRVEVATALASGLRVIPVLVGGASMPSAAQLPADLQTLAFRNALTVDHQSFNRDMDVLEEGLHTSVASAVTAAPAAAPATVSPGKRRTVLIATVVSFILAGLVVAVIARGGDKKSGTSASSTSSTTAPSSSITTVVTSTTTAPTTVTPSTIASGRPVTLPATAQVIGVDGKQAYTTLTSLGLVVTLGDWCSESMAVGLARQLTVGTGINGPVLIDEVGQPVDDASIAALRTGDTVTLWVVNQVGGCSS